MRKFLGTAAVAAVLSVGALAVSTSGAAAYVVCNGEGDCWHTDHHYHYGPAVRIESHPDDWYFHRDWNNDHDHHWREYHDGRGYWHNGVWITF